MKYAHNMNECRRHVMAHSFNEAETVCAAQCRQTCDVCIGNEDDFEMRDITKDAVLINKILCKTNNKKNKSNKLSMSQLVDVWRGNSSTAVGKRLIADLNIAKMK